MPKFRPRATLEAVQLTWQNWNEVCELVGEFPEGTRGVWVSPEGVWSDVPDPDSRIGFIYDHPRGYHILAVENDWIIRGTTGRIFHCPEEAFEAAYEPVDDYN